MRVARRVAKTSRIANAARHTASVRAMRFSSADCRSSRIEAVVSSTTTAPTMSSPTKTGCAAERMATSRSRVPRQCVEETPMSARSICARTGFDSSPAGTSGEETTSETTGFSHDGDGGARCIGARGRRLAKRSREPAHARARVHHPQARGAPAHDVEEALDLLRGRVGGAQARGGLGIGRGEEADDAAALLVLGVAGRAPPGGKSAGRSESAEATARAVTAMSCSCASAQEGLHAAMNCAASAGWRAAPGGDEEPEADAVQEGRPMAAQPAERGAARLTPFPSSGSPCRTRSRSRRRRGRRRGTSCGCASRAR